MPPLAPSRQDQESFAAGMFRSIAPELIPSNGAYDLTNSLLDEDGADTKRGGSVYEADPLGTPFTMLWTGWLASGQETVAATSSDLYLVSGGVATIVPGSAGVSGPHRPVVMAGVMYLPGGQTFDGSTIGAAAETAPFYASVANRLLAADGDIVKFSAFGDPSTFDPTDFHQLPGGVEIIGIEGLRDSAVVFTTDGIYVIGNMSLNLTDPDGNVQQTVDRYSADMTLWGEAGIAGWSGSLVVPALDGVWVMSLGLKGEAAQHFNKISLPIDDLYRDYVRQGFSPGIATVHRSHYVLPIVDGADVVDVLVSRLDGVDRQGNPTFPWTHMDGLSGRALGYATRLDDSPIMLAIVGDAVLRCHWFDPEVASTDADDSVPAWEIITRAYATGSLNRNTVLKLRARYDMRANHGSIPGITAGVSLPGFTGTSWGLFDWGEADWTALGVGFQELDGVAPVDVGAVAPFSWQVGKKMEFVTFRLQQIEDTAALSLRGLEVFIRDAGRL